jgi:hypothetical protein
MILNSLRTKIVSSYGWKDRGAFSIVDVRDRSVASFNLECATYITVKIARSNHFVCVHHFNDKKLILTIQSFDAPSEVKGRISIINGQSTFEGNDEVWSLSPRFFIGYFRGQYSLIEICARNREIFIHPLEWFTLEKYDLGYEAPMDAIEIPAQDYLLISVCRRAPVLYDLSKKIVSREVFIGGHNFTFIKQNSEIWATSYDELVKSDIRTLKPILSKIFQPPLNGHSNTAIGDFSFSPDEKFCALARPFSHDILILEPESMNEVARIKSEHQPYQIVMLDNNECVYRDHQKGILEFQSFSI